MDLKEVNRYDFDQLAEYANQELSKGRTQKSISIDDFKMTSDSWLRITLKRNGYELIGKPKRFHKINEQLEGQINIDNIDKEATQEPQEGEEVLRDMKAPIKEEVVTKPQEVEKQMSNTIASKEVKFIKTEGEKGQRITFEVDKKIIQALRFKKVAENSKGFIINNYIEQLLLDNIEKKYFDMVDK